jgi:hypothetical protein
MIRKTNSGVSHEPAGLVYLGKRIHSWRQFDRRVRPRGCTLLSRLDDFPGAILVAGCQRSGTTILARVLTQSEGMVNYWFGKDDELDAALILSGQVELDPVGRYCFQTTYLNNCVEEYFAHSYYKLIWVLRNPFSVVFSMLHNWRRAALNRLFRSCGAMSLAGGEKRRYELLGTLGVRRIRKACLSYNARVSQVFELKTRLDSDRLMVVDYKDLVEEKAHFLPRIYQFAGLEFNEQYLHKIRSDSLNKSLGQSRSEAEMVEKLCLPVYQAARGALTKI